MISPTLGGDYLVYFCIKYFSNEKENFGIKFVVGDLFDVLPA